MHRGSASAAPRALAKLTPSDLPSRTIPSCGTGSQLRMACLARLSANSMVQSGFDGGGNINTFPRTSPNTSYLLDTFEHYCENMHCVKWTRSIARLLRLNMLSSSTKDETKLSVASTITHMNFGESPKSLHVNRAFSMVELNLNLLSF